VIGEIPGETCPEELRDSCWRRKKNAGIRAGGAGLSHQSLKKEIFLKEKEISMVRFAGKPKIIVRQKIFLMKGERSLKKESCLRG